MSEQKTNPKPKVWTPAAAIELCKEVERICPPFGCHVALTGGCLYGEGMRKDCDLLFYRILQRDHIDADQLWKALDDIGLQKKSGFGWCFKATYQDKPVDIFFPEELQTSNDPEYGMEEEIEIVAINPQNT
jgi:hypothetical protein